MHWGEVKIQLTLEPSPSLFLPLHFLSSVEDSTLPQSALLWHSFSDRKENKADNFIRGKQTTSTRRKNCCCYNIIWLKTDCEILAFPRDQDVLQEPLTWQWRRWERIANGFLEPETAATNY